VSYIKILRSILLNSIIKILKTKLNNMKCICCDREQELRIGVCFDCMSAESIIIEGKDAWDKKIPRHDIVVEGVKVKMTTSLSTLRHILKMYGVVKNK